MSDRWSLWKRNVIDRYKNWSTEYLPVEASKNEYGHSGSAQAAEAN